MANQEIASAVVISAKRQAQAEVRRLDYIAFAPSAIKALHRIRAHEEAGVGQLDD